MVGLAVTVLNFCLHVGPPPPWARRRRRRPPKRATSRTRLRRHERVLRAGGDEDGLDAGELVVHLGHLQLVLEVRHGPQAADDGRGPDVAGHVHDAGSSTDTIRTRRDVGRATSSSISLRSARSNSGSSSSAGCAGRPRPPRRRDGWPAPPSRDGRCERDRRTRETVRPSCLGPHASVPCPFHCQVRPQIRCDGPR